MISGQATEEGTLRFAKRHGKAPGAFAEAQGLLFSTIGFGSYAPHPHQDENYFYSLEEAVHTALKEGCNVLDTAVNYRYQQSEREVGKALAAAIKAGDVARDEVVLASKGGFIPLDYPFPENPYRWIETEIVNRGLAEADEVYVDQYCMEPDYLQWSFEQSLKNLDVDHLDVFYLHNPEMALGYISYEAMLEKIEKAFALFETWRKEGKITWYGVATWNALTFEPENMEYIRLEDLAKAAEKAGGRDHGLRFVQLPFNLAKPHGANYRNQPLEDGFFYTPFQAAKKLGMHVVTSSSLLQMNLFQRPFSQTVRETLGRGLVSDTQCALQFARSAPEVTTALVGSKDPEHIIHDLAVLRRVPLSTESFAELFSL